MSVGVQTCWDEPGNGHKVVDGAVPLHGVVGAQLLGGDQVPDSDNRNEIQTFQ